MTVAAVGTLPAAAEKPQAALQSLRDGALALIGMGTQRCGRRWRRAVIGAEDKTGEYQRWDTARQRTRRFTVFTRHLFLHDDGGEAEQREKGDQHGQSYRRHLSKCHRRIQRTAGADKKLGNIASVIGMTTSRAKYKNATTSPMVRTVKKPEGI
jgi:hypothetical protein